MDKWRRSALINPFLGCLHTLPPWDIMKAICVCVWPTVNGKPVNKPSHHLSDTNSLTQGDWKLGWYRRDPNLESIRMNAITGASFDCALRASSPENDTDASAFQHQSTRRIVFSKPIASSNSLLRHQNPFLVSVVSWQSSDATLNAPDASLQQPHSARCSDISRACRQSWPWWVVF